jgi:hypothetical protein
MKGQNNFAKGNQGIMDIQDKLDKIKSRQLGRLVGELKKINTSQIVIDGVEKYFNYFYLDILDSIKQNEGNSGTYDNSNKA